MRRTVNLFIVAMCLAVPAIAGQDQQAPVAPAQAPQAAVPPIPAPMSGQRVMTPPAARPRVTAPTPMAAQAGTRPAAPRMVDPRIDQSDVNIKLTVTITDKSATTMTKVVSLIMANRGNGRVRSSGISTVTATGERRSSDLNVDAGATLFKSGVISTNLTISYQPEWTAEETKMTGVTQSVSLFLKDGVPMLITQAADPTKGSRSVSIEVTAAVLK